MWSMKNVAPRVIIIIIVIIIIFIFIRFDGGHHWGSGVWCSS